MSVVRRLREAALVAAVLSTPVVAQANCVFGPANAPGSGSCSVRPFGPSTGEKIQFLITAAELGNQPLLISDIAFAPCGTGLYSFGRLQVRLKQVTGPLGTDFVTNIGGGALNALDNLTHDWPVVANQWNNIGLERTFAYNPNVGDLLVQIRATTSTFSGSTPGMHEHARQSLVTSGFTGAPPRTGTLVASAPRFRICADRASIDRFGVGCGPGPLRIESSGLPQLNSSFNLWLTNGNPAQSSLAAIALGINHQEFGVAPGCTAHTSAEASWLVFAQNGTTPSVSVALPNSPVFAGVKLYAQGANLHPGASTIDVTVSDYLIATVGF